jgi:uncharacterized protein
MESEIQKISQPQKRNTAYKLRIGSILSAKPTIEAERLKHIEINDKTVVRVNIIANIVDKYIQEGEKKFGSITLDDATGQIKVKTFGDDVERLLLTLNQGDTINVIGLLRYWNNEIYVTPEIIKKKEPEFLLVRKIESESEEVKQISTENTHILKNKIIDLTKESEKNGGIDIEKIVTDLKESSDLINQEIKKLLEDGIIYEPRPGKIRWLG